MHNTLIISLTILLGIPGPCSAQQPVWVSQSTVQEVKIYLSGATVSRTAKASLKPGLQEIILDGLSPYVNAQSITLKGSGDATIHSVSFHQNYLQEQKRSPLIQRLETELDSLLLLSSRLKSKLQVNNETQKLLLANTQAGSNQQGVKASDLNQLAEYFAQKLGKLQEEQLELQQREKPLNEAITRIRQQLITEKQALQRPTGNLVVRMDAKQAGPVQFEFSYLITTAASWTPYYELRSTGLGEPVEVIYKAKISQQTGEDWNNVKLSLHGNQPAAGSQRPFLSPWYLNFMPSLQEVAVMGHRKSQEMRGAVPMAAGAADSNVPELNSLEVSTGQDQLAYSYRIETPYSIPSDGREYQVEIQRNRLDAQYTHIAVPKSDNDAFLVARVMGWQDLGLMPAQAGVYFEGTYTGEAYVQTSADYDTLELSLGRDKRILIKRERVKDVSGAVLIGGKRERRFSYETTVQNLRKDSVDLILIDQIPVNMQKDINIDLEERAGATLNEQSGELTWRLELKGGQSLRKKFSFKVRWPKDQTIQGL